MTFEQWSEAMSKEVFLLGDEDPKVENKIFEMMDEDLMDEES